jgi:redox-sensitive bicupin YhaK (pirin superfamily)
LLLDQLGPLVNGPAEGGGAPWHPHRGFETVSYVMAGEISHHDTNGGGGVIAEGDTQWMTAGSGILHDELPTERTYRLGGPAHAVQLWVNLPSSLKFTTPRYQAITRGDLLLLTNDDGGALLRLIAGNIADYQGPGATHTPITYLHATIAPGARLCVPWIGDPRADRALRAVRDEQPRRDHPSHCRPSGWPARDRSGRPDGAAPVLMTPRSDPFQPVTQRSST